MVELEPSEFGRLAALPLWRGLDNYLPVASVLGGSTPGRVYVDDVQAPGGALLHTGGRFYLAGDPGAEHWRRDLHSFFLDCSRPRADGPGGFGLHYAGPDWPVALDEILAGTDHFPVQYLYLELDTRRADPPPALPPGFRVRPVDRRLLAEEQLDRLAELRQEMTSECPSVEFFLEHRFGVCLQLEGSLAGWCLSEYDHGDRCEVGIETAPLHRRRGLGTTSALALAAEARARGIGRVGWHCYQGNEASVATALRAGFQTVASYELQVIRYGGHDSRIET